MACQTCKWEPTKIVSATPDLASRWFGMTEADIERQCGRFTKGKHKGELRGWIVYHKVREGGWSFASGGVFKPGLIFAQFAKTYDESSELFNLPTDKFVHGATRVDTCYGHCPVKSRAEIAARIAAMPSREELERAERAKSVDSAYDTLMEQDHINKLAVRIFYQTRDAFVFGGLPAVEAYKAESIELSARAAGAVA